MPGACQDVPLKFNLFWEEKPMPEGPNVGSKKVAGNVGASMVFYEWDIRIRRDVPLGQMMQAWSIAHDKSEGMCGSGCFGPFGCFIGSIEKPRFEHNGMMAYLLQLGVVSLHPRPEATKAAHAPAPSRLRIDLRAPEHTRVVNCLLPRHHPRCNPPWACAGRHPWRLSSNPSRLLIQSSILKKAKHSIQVQKVLRMVGGGGWG
jgi:hypothetical protein